MDHSRDLDLGLMHSLATVGPTQRRIFGMSDFNARAMVAREGARGSDA
jgi:hypothetical protein